VIEKIPNMLGEDDAVGKVVGNGVMSHFVVIEEGV
jgi:hypothetical protein